MRPHKNLIAWQEAYAFVKDIYLYTSRFPNSEKYGLSSQLQRAAVSVPANISEGAARNSKREFVRFLQISSGSLCEVETLLQIARDLNYLNESDFKQAEKQMNRIASLLQGLIKKLKSEIT